MIVDYGAITDLASYVETMPNAARNAARIALNDVTQREGLDIFRDAIAAEIDFPPGYLNADRLGIESLARNTDLAVTIVGRDRPTSLARFVQGGNAAGQYGVRVRVKGGVTRTIKNGFLLSLKNGNRALAVRLRPGETLRNTTGAKRLRDNVYLLYGPSVDQVFREVGPAEAPVVMSKIEAEFYRQFFRLTK